MKYLKYGWVILVETKITFFGLAGAGDKVGQLKHSPVAVLIDYNVPANTPRGHYWSIEICNWLTGLRIGHLVSSAFF